jgi:cytosine/adenosine deaminase-related metal-dependent hydrolase
MSDMEATARAAARLNKVILDWVEAELASGVPLDRVFKSICIGTGLAFANCLGSIAENDKADAAILDDWRRNVSRIAKDFRVTLAEDAKPRPKSHLQ